MSVKNEEKYTRPVSSSKNREEKKEKVMNYAQYKSKNRPQTGTFK